MKSELPILYSYRRCPYAMRARMALRYAEIAVDIREITLRDKPQHMLHISPKATVPVLMLPDGTVIDESLDIMRYALERNDPQDWLMSEKYQLQPHAKEQARDLIAENDGSFKSALDRYKYASRFPEKSPETYRAEGEIFLAKLESRLGQHFCLLRESCSMADIAIFPFVRQFALVDSTWFEHSPYPALRAWLNGWLNSALFLGVMEKQTPWQESPGR
jgi:glutathione S-transferase